MRQIASTNDIKRLNKIINIETRKKNNGKIPGLEENRNPQDNLRSFLLNFRAFSEVIICLLAEGYFSMEK